MLNHDEKLLQLKINKSKQILTNELKCRHSDVTVIWTTGRDSTCLLCLIKDTYGKVPFPILFPDTGFHYKETYEFRDKITKVFKLNLINVKPNKSQNKKREDFESCCYRLKVEPIIGAIKKEKLKALVSPLRWSAKESFIEGKISETSINKIDSHLRIIEPIAHWTEKDVLRFSKEKELPFNPLYATGIQNITCKTCQHQPLGKRDVQSLKDAEKIVERLESLGYF